MTNKEYYEMVEEANNYAKSYCSCIIEKGKYVFKEGKEKDFAKFLESWTKTVKDTHLAGREYMDMSRYVESLMEIFINNLTTLNWEKVWLNIDPTIYIEDNKFIFKYLMKQISFDTFKEKINKCNDLTLVYNLYNLYANVNNLPFKKIYNKYVSYVDEVIKRTNSSYAEILNNLLDLPGINYIEEYPDIICILMKKADLNYPVSYKSYTKDTITLNTKVAICLSHSVIATKNEKRIINAFLSATKEMYFDISGSFDTDICDLNIIVGNIEEARRIFNSDEYQLYSQEQLDELTKNREYNYEDYGYPVDRLYNLIQHAYWEDYPEFTKELLYSDKVKIINAGKLLLIQHMLKSKEEYIKYLAYLIKNNIIIYENEGKVKAFNNMREALKYSYGDSFGKNNNYKIKFY